MLKVLAGFTQALGGCAMAEKSSQSGLGGSASWVWVQFIVEVCVGFPASEKSRVRGVSGIVQTF